MLNFKIILVGIICIFCLPLSAISNESKLHIPDDVQSEIERLPEEVSFNFHIKPILSDRCFKCHGPDEGNRMVNLRLDQAESAYGPLLLGDGAAIVPHKPNESVLLQRVLAENPSRRMPPKESKLDLNAREKALLYRWIQQGGEYQPHWSLIPISKSLDLSAWPSDAGIDYFIENKLKQKGFSFNKQAKKEILLRRLAFDLTGLPPTLDEIDAFLQDDSPNAYEKVVDRLLASPHYGERMAVEWLDLARYADTYGYQADNARPMWRWRDWVIEAYNKNMPYDKFLHWQLAGDLMPDPSKKQILATAFNRSHQQNAEGGIINEEYRVEYVSDRTDTFGKAFLGLTMECARCHDHKFDPISQKEYYQLFAFFNNVDEAGQITWSKHDIPSPSLLFPTDEEQKKLNSLSEDVTRLETKLAEYKKRNADEFQQWYQRVQKENQFESLQPRGKIAQFSLDEFENDLISNEIDNATGRVVDPVSMNVIENRPEFVAGKFNQAIQVDGDMMLDFLGLGKFQKADPFSVGVWIQVPEELKQGVIFHSNRGGILYSYKGYQVSIEENRFDIRFAHTFPYNSIHLLSKNTVLKNEWIHILLAYDGSGRASGVNFYVNGEPQELESKRDNLYKEIVFTQDNVATNLRVGARWRSRGFTHGQIDEISVYRRALSALEAQWAAGQSAFSAFANQQYEELTNQQKTHWRDFYFNNFDTTYQAMLNQLRSRRNKFNELQETVDEVMVIDEMPKPRQAYLLRRGMYDDHGQKVEPNTPESILPFPDSYPQNRLGLAQWLTHPDNPLTARVAVNRMWQRFFDKGLVKTAEDFGSQGDLPTHPQLLDWLAWQFIQSGWDIKALQKKIVMSKTYRQSSIASDELLKKAPNNKWYARGPKERLRAEMMRDQALAASGLLVRKIGGPSVKPYQPDGLWSFGSNSNYEQDQGEKLYRRSLYTFWKRTVPPPSMNIFDAPSRSRCTVRRPETNTPLQALVLINDPQYVEAARAAAWRVVKQDYESNKHAIENLYRMLTSKSPSNNETALLHELYSKQKQTFEIHPERMKGFLQVGEFEVDQDYEPQQLAAFSVVANAVMNSDAFIVKR